MSILRLKDENGNWQDVPAIIGPQGEPGKDGVTGADGKSAYQIWLEQGNTGTEADFLASLVGPQGPEGELPDLSEYVKFVNGVGPDENGNVIIAGETEDDFKVYRVKDGYTLSNEGITYMSFTLNEEALRVCQELVDDYFAGVKKQILILDSYIENRYITRSLVFIPYESKSTNNLLYFQCLTPVDKQLNYAISGNCITLGIWGYNLSLTLVDGVITNHTLNATSSNKLDYITLDKIQTGDYTFKGLHTYNKLPQSSVEPTDAKDLVNKAYVDSLGGGGASGNIDGLQDQVNKIQEKIDNGFMVLGDDDLQALWSVLGITVDYINTAMLYLGYGCGAFQIMSDTFKFRFDSGTSYTFKRGTIIIVTGEGRITYVLVNGDDPNLYMTYHTVTPTKYTSYPSKVYSTYTNNYLWLDALSKLSYTPTENHHTATKQYVDNTVTTALGDIESLLSEV